MKLSGIIVLLAGLGLMATGCGDDDDTTRSSEKDIISFVFDELEPDVAASIDNENTLITATVPSGTSLTTLVPAITISEKATVDPPSGQPQDFTNSVIYTVTAEDGTKKAYTVVVNEEASSGKEILSFVFEEFEPDVTAAIDEANAVVTAEVPFGSSLKSLTPTIGISDKAGIDPPSGQPADFSTPQIYTVTAEDGTKRLYTVVVSVGKSNENELRHIRISENKAVGAIDQSTNNVAFHVPFGTDLTALSFDYILSDEASADPPVAQKIDLSTGGKITVTAENGDVREYSVEVAFYPQDKGVRGVWLTNVASNALNSRADIRAAVELVEELNMNTIFMVVWNKGLTLFDSDVAEAVTGTRIDPVYGNVGRDPLQELIEETNAVNTEKGTDIKVVAWFEYGFASQFGQPGQLLNDNPDWAARDNQGNIVEKNNFYWMNGLLPDVQQFMTDLFKEVVQDYDIYGVQGDDRLPAMPVEAGYDDYTVNLYKTEHGGAEPPADFREDNWIQWRVDKINDYSQTLYDEMKALDPQILVMHGPHPMTFGRREYLQDYTTWLNNGYTDSASPQLYRRDDQGIGVYRGLLESQLVLINNDKLERFFPGILLQVGSYVPNEEFLADMIYTHRDNNIQGEVYFFFEGLKARKELFKNLYPAKAIYPDL